MKVVQGSPWAHVCVFALAQGLQLWGLSVVKENAMTRTPSSQAHPSPNNDCSMQIIVVVVVISGRKRRAQELGSCWFPASRTSKAAGWPSAEAWRRVLKPTHEIMSEGLPQPDV